MEMRSFLDYFLSLYGASHLCLKKISITKPIINLLNAKILILNSNWIPKEIFIV